MKRFATMLGLAALMLCMGANAQVYKWTDKQGRVHYSDTAPKDIESEEVSERLRDAVSTYTPSPLDTAVRPKPAIRYGTPEIEIETAAPVVVEIIPVEFELTRAEEQQIREEIEHMYRSYVELLGWSPRPRRPVKIRIFGRLAAWDAYPKTIEPALAHRSHYSSARGEVIMHGTRFNIDAIEILRHEVSHAIFHMEIGYAPQWIDEGLAEVFRTSGAGRGSSSVSPNRAGIEIAKMKIREGSLEPWARYVDIPFAEWRGESRVVETTYYRIASSMMSFLLSSPGGTACLRNVLAHSRTSGFGVLSKTYEQHCGDLKQLDADWRKWAGRQ
jgi:hypothetical protein